jgi:hypothetical protein
MVYFAGIRWKRCKSTHLNFLFFGFLQIVRKLHFLVNRSISQHFTFCTQVLTILIQPYRFSRDKHHV